jgi:GNAT superfamily N-acetyltransferase
MMKRRNLEGRLEFLDLGPQHTSDIFTLCPGCIYWELPEQFDKRPPRDEMRALKEQWLAIHSTSQVLGKVARAGRGVRGFIQFGPPELYPQRLGYRSGPVSADAMLITCLFVARRYRGLGIARRLLSLAEQTAAQHYGYAALEALVRKGSANNPSGPIELYLECGFEIFRDHDEFPLVRKVLQPCQV